MSSVQQSNCIIYDPTKQQNQNLRSHLSVDHVPSVSEHQTPSAQLKQFYQVSPNFQQRQNFLHQNNNQNLQETTIPINARINNYQQNFELKQTPSQFSYGNYCPESKYFFYKKKMVFII